jgi:hypothetical protein
MNKTIKSLLAILGGVEAIFNIVAPILIVLLWLKVMPVNEFGTYVLYAAGIITSVFRAIKIGWFIK